MNDANLKVLTNIIGAVESGGQVYGKRRYDAYDDPYKNSPKEHTITIGWYQAYGHEARQLIQAIHDADPALFDRLDSAGVGGMLSKDWVAIKWKPTAAQKNVILALIDSTVGHAVQDRIFADKMKALIADCARDYTEDVKAQMMYCEIRHLGGKSPCDRIFKRCNGDYSLDRIMTALVQDQRDVSSDNQVGDTRYWSRHVKCRTFIETYAVDETPEEKEVKGMTEAQAIDRVIAIAEAEVGYHEKASNKDLYDKKKNAGSGNWTKYGVEMHRIQPSNMDIGEAWCDAFVDWCFCQAFTPEIAKKVLCGNFDDYTPNSAALYRKAGRWSTVPKRGYQAFFQNSERICHTGLVYHFDGKRFYTIEGNADNEVRKKSWSVGDPYVAGFGMPLYSAAADAPEPKPSLTDKVKAFQRWINTNYARILDTAGVGQLLVDGVYGNKTRAAALAVWKYMANKYYGSNLTVGNENFFGACKQVAAKMTDAEIAKHYTLQEIKNGVLAGRGFESVKAFQKANGLSETGKMDADTWYALFN